MEANELRIGNYVNVPGIYRDISEVLEICEDRANLSGLKLKFHAFYPIPITEEWLIRFGFEKSYYNDYYQFFDLGYFRVFIGIKVPDSIFVSWNIRQIENSIDNLKVHQLQNLYFALTGEELKLNEI